MNHPIMMTELIERYRQNNEIEKLAPEFNFVWEIAKEIKQRGCYCGINKKISESIESFNKIAENLPQETVQNLLKFFNQDELCFGILRPNNFYIKSYSNQAGKT